MFGRDDLKDLRGALAACGCDMNAFKDWQRQYGRLMKQMPSVRTQYENALVTTQEVYVTAQELERVLVAVQAGGAGVPGRDAEKEFAAMIKDLKKVQNTFDHAFLISSDDREFHSTYDSVLRLGAKALKDGQQRLILQSEVENLLALLKENLQKEEPQLCALCFFYQEHADRELAELPPAKRVERIVDIYREEFEKPIMRILLSGISYADSRRAELERCDGRRERREAERLRFLWNSPGSKKSAGERAQEILDELTDRGEER